MPGRSSNNVPILFKVETTTNTDAAPTGSADAVLMSGDWTLDIDHRTAQRDIQRGYFAGPDQIIWARYGKASFSVEMAGSGTAGTAAQWGDLVICSGFAETVTAATVVDYTPVSTGFKSGTCWGYKDGLLYKFVGMFGNLKGSIKIGEIPTYSFEFNGLIIAAPVNASNITPNLALWKRPQAASPVTTAKAKFGGSYAAGALSAGTDIDFREFSWDMGNDVQLVALATAESWGIYGRNPTGKIVVDMTGAQEATYLANAFAGTTSSLGILHGSVAGNKCGFFAPAATISNMGTEKQGSVMLVSMDFAFQPVSGNDEVRLFTL
jgi:hypothetical protein